MRGLAQLIDQRISLHDVAVSAGVERRDGGVQGGKRGHQKKKRPRGNFLGEFEKVDSTLAGHSNVGNDDVKDLRFELAPGGFHAMYHFNAVTFLSEGDLQQLADGFLVVDDEKSIGELLEITFRKEGHRVEVVHSVEAARRK